MPSGPSHSSHSSGGGSHSGGGRGSFGGGVTGGSFGSYNSRPRRPITIHLFGRPILVSVGAQNTLLSMFVLFVFMVFFSVACLIGYASNANQLAKNQSMIATYEADAKYYENLITKAKAGEEGYYLTNASFANRFYYSYDEDDFASTGIFEYQYINGVSYYFIVYSYENDLGETLKAETYTQFTSTQARAMAGTIEIAYTYDAEEGGYFSINTSYSLEKNQDYNALKAELDDVSDKSLLIIGIVFLVISVGLLIGLIFVIRNQIKKSKKQAEVDAAKHQAEIAEANANAEKAKAEANKKNRYCTYCGAPVPDGADQCEACGARLFEKKK